MVLDDSSDAMIVTVFLAFKHLLHWRCRMIQAFFLGGVTSAAGQSQGSYSVISQAQYTHSHTYVVKWVPD